MEYTTCHLLFLGIQTEKNASDSSDIPEYTTRKRCVNSKYLFSASYVSD